MAEEFQKIQFEADFEHDGRRFDQVLVELAPDYSRSLLQNSIKQGLSTLNGLTVKPKEKVRVGDRIELVVSEPVVTNWEPENIPIERVYEDEHLLVINKPENLVVHPAAGNYSGTLVNALLYAYPEQASLPRAGIVHRLDKDTSGLMVVARSRQAHFSLVEQLQARTMGREYEALIVGSPTGGGTVEAPIGRDPRNRLKMTVTEGGKAAKTDYRVLKRWPGVSLVRLKLHSGRTHQIRVHMAHLRWPVLGDPLYGKGQLPKAADPALRDAFAAFSRQALHACHLELDHPQTGERMAWDTPLSNDIQALVNLLDQVYEQE